MANSLSILPPSVNNLTARIFVRAAGLEFEETNVWGQTTEPEFLAKDPAHLTPLLEEAGLPRGSLWESCAIMQYLCNRHGLDQLYPTDPGARAMVDSAMFYLIGTFYPLLARATYPTLGFARLPGRGQHLGRRRRGEGRGRSRPRSPRWPSRWRPSTPGSCDPVRRRRAGLDRRHPLVGDARVPARRSTTTSRPGAAEYMAAVEDALGAAYSEPAEDVRGYIESVRSPA